MKKMIFSVAMTNKTLKLLSLFSIMTLTLVGCNKSGQQKIAMPDTLIYQDFPKEINLKETSGTIDDIGLSYIKIQDDYIIISHGSFKPWSIFSRSNGEKLGDILSIGQGPTEFQLVPNPTSGAYTLENDSLVVYLDDQNQHRVMRLNIPKEIETGSGLSEAFRSDSLNNRLWMVKTLGKDKVLVQKPSEDFSSFRRIIVTPDSTYEIPVTRHLSKIAIPEGDDFKINLLAKISGYNPSNKKVVEAMSFFNQINLYSLEDDWGKTICIGTDLDKVEDVMARNKNDMHFIHWGLTSWDDAFGVIYMDAGISDIGKGNVNHVEIRIFDWDGNPIARIPIDRNIKSFDIDFSDNLMYAVDATEDKVVTYDISPYIDVFKPKGK